MHQLRSGCRQSRQRLAAFTEEADPETQDEKCVERCQNPFAGANTAIHSPRQQARDRSERHPRQDFTGCRTGRTQHHKTVTSNRTGGFQNARDKSLVKRLIAREQDRRLNAAMGGVLDGKAIWLGVAASIPVCLSFIYLWREWTTIAVIVAAVFLLMGGFMPSRRSRTFVHSIYGGSIVGMVCAMGWLMLAWRLNQP